MIKIEDVSFSRAGKQVLHGASLQIFPGEKHLVLGQSGSGKSTLLRLLLGFDRPDSGKISIDGMTLTRDHIKAVRSRLFYLSQDVELPNISGEQIIEESIKYNHLPPMTAEKISDYLEVLSLSAHLLRQNADVLSGGERQRLGLLLCFLLDRPVWLLDEPTSALDSQAKSRIADYIANTERTVLVISHDQVWQTITNIKTKIFG